jgi:gamma-D-glutamyl-L-lysine dipeptidyl-peptidase
MASPRSVRVAVAAVRAEPDDEAEQVTQALLHEPVAVEAVGPGGWARIRTAYDYPGWIREEQLGAPTGAGWPAVAGESDAVEAARAYLGAPYEWGGMTAAGIDCSGLVHMAYRLGGRLVPRDADQQEDAGVVDDEPGYGTLVTYGDEAGSRATHIAFWLGDGRILHASGSAHRVLEEPEPEHLIPRRRMFFRL